MKLEFDDSRLASQLFGPHNQHLKLMGERMGVRLESRGNAVSITSDEGGEGAADQAGQVLSQLYAMLKAGKSLYPQDVDFACGSRRPMWGKCSREMSTPPRASAPSLRNP